MAAPVVGRYALFAEIAAGGMATVHFGRLFGPHGFARTVAVKRLHPQFAKDPEFVKMFLDEAKVAARIRHPNVVPTLDVVSTNDELLLIMDYVHGESLARLLSASKSPPDPAIVATLVHSVLLGLHAAHTATNDRGEPLRIVHRDISPQNVLVGSDGVARVVDFGVAKAADRSQTTRDGQLKGKLAYMPPEQLMAHEVSARSDIYSTAVVLWEALAHKRLFRSNLGPGALVSLIMTTEIPAPSSLSPGIPSALDAVTLRGLARDPAERFATAREMADALEDAIQLVSASRVSDWVGELASDVLRGRAAQLADIESSSHQEPASGASLTIAPGSSPSGAASRTPAESTQLSSLSVEASRADSPSPRGRGIVLAAFAGVVIVAAAIVSLTRAMTHVPAASESPASPSAIVSSEPSPVSSHPAIAPMSAEPAVPSSVVAAPDAGAPRARVQRAKSPKSGSDDDVFKVRR